MWAVRDTSRLARPMYMIEIRLKCKHFILNFDHSHGALNSYKLTENSRKCYYIVVNVQPLMKNAKHSEYRVLNRYAYFITTIGGCIMRKNRIKKATGVMCLLMSAMLSCTPAMAYTGESWYNTDIDGAVTEETPEARAQDDFNLFANREYIMQLEIPEGMAGTGSFTGVAQITNQMCLDAVKDDTVGGSDAELVRQYFAMQMDWDTRNSQGVEPAMPYLNELRAIDSLEDMTAWFADRSLGGLTAYDDIRGNWGKTGCLFSYCVRASSDDPGVRVLKLAPIRLSLNSIDEYKELSENGKILKARRTARWTALLEHLGFSEDEAAQMIENTFALEGMLAAIQTDTKELDNPSDLSIYWNPADMAGLEEMCGAFPVREILTGWGMDQVNQYNVSDPAYMKALADIYTEENLEILRDWLTVRTADQWVYYLNRATRDDVRDAENNVMGIQGVESDETTAMVSIRDDMLIPLDNLYITKYCTPELRSKIREIIDMVLTEYHSMLEEEDWLSETMRSRAVEKLDNIVIHDVYPETIDTWDDFEFEEGCSLLEACRAARQYGQDQVLSTVNLPVDRSYWDRTVMPVSTANASYNPMDNSINIMGGMLNGIIYQDDYSYEEVLGIVGMIIGHEISHAFDPLGSQYDKDGGLAPWWTDEDRAAFDERTQKLIDYYDNLELFDGITYDGSRVQGEAVADMGGLKCLLRIVDRMEGFDYNRFFEAFAKLWAVRYVKSVEINIAKADVHPLGYLRTNVTVMQFDKFQEVYDVKEGDGMYLAPEDRICIW